MLKMAGVKIFHKKIIYEENHHFFYHMFVIYNDSYIYFIVKVPVQSCTELTQCLIFFIRFLRLPIKFLLRKYFISFHLVLNGNNFLVFFFFCFCINGSGVLTGSPIYTPIRAGVLVMVSWLLFIFVISNLWTFRMSA